MKLIANWMKQVIDYRDDEEKLAELKREVVEFSRNHPLPY